MKNLILRMAVILTAAAALFYSGCNDSADSDITGGGHVDDLIEKTRGTNEPKAYTLKVTVSPTAGGSVSKSPDKAQYSKGESVMLTATAKAGYRFTGWSGSQTSTGVEVLVKMDANKELIANFLQENVVSYTLTINTSPTAGGTVSKSPDKPEYAAGDMVYVVATSKPGYVFTIWSGSSSSKDSAFTITMDSKKELTANFALATTTYTVTFSANGGGGTITGQNAKAGTNITLPDGSKLSRNGYTFGGWNTNNSGTGDFYSPGSSFSVTGNVTLYAVWNDVSTPTTYTITFDANGGIVSPASAKTGTDSKLASLPTPTRDGYNFDGWYTAETGGTKVELSRTYTANATIYARWEAIQVTLPTYTITFNANGGTVSSTSSTTGTDGKLTSLPTPTRTGYTFDGWYTAETGGTKVELSRAYTANATIYARWTLITYTITFNANGGTVNPTSSTTGSDGKLASLPTPTRSDYTFNGWYTATTGGTAVTESREYSANTTIYAQWTPVTYTIIYNLDGGTVSSDNPASYTVETTAFTLRNPTKTGYTFAGWTGNNGTTPQTAVSIQRGSSGNRNYTANWTLIAYTITFNANGGTVSQTSANTNSYGQLASLPTPTRNGYTFDGWYTAATGGTEVTTGTVFTANATIIARWTIRVVDPTPAITTFVDSRDDRTYKKVTVGSQVWMAENLNYDVPSVTSDVCYYSNGSANCDKYGRLYNWSTAMNGSSSSSATPSGVRGVCPIGWHLPSDAEWTQLENAVGGSSTAGTKLKATSGWNKGGSGTDEYGFAALPGGCGVSGGGFLDAGDGGGWWSATEFNAGYAWYRSMYNSREDVFRNYYVKSDLFSVRCVAD